jgi:hypothetical protein
MKQIFTFVVALLAGFVGGVCGTLVVRAREEPHTERVIRAHSFELVDKAGKVISYWGLDKNQYAVLAFGSLRPATTSVRGGLPGGSPIGLEDPDNQRAAVGVIDDTAFLMFRGADGKTRMSLSLSMYEKPILWMADETGKRVSLGVEHTDTPGPGDNNWALDFGPDRARIGMFTVEERGQTYVKGLFSVNRDKIKYLYQQSR